MFTCVSVVFISRDRVFLQQRSFAYIQHDECVDSGGKHNALAIRQFFALHIQLDATGGGDIGI